MTLLPSNVAELDRPAARDYRGVAVATMDTGTAETGACETCGQPAPLAYYDLTLKRNVYACSLKDGIGQVDHGGGWNCVGRALAAKRAKDAALAKAAEQETTPKTPAPKSTRPRAQRVSQAKAKLDQAKETGDG